MQHISTSVTVILKYFVPTIWIIFFGTMTILFFMQGDVGLFGLPASIFKLIFTSFFLLGVALLYFTFIQIKRVEIDDNFLYVTNYLKIFKYPFSNIERIREVNYGLFILVRVYFKEPGYFGKKIIFIASQRRYADFFRRHPNVARKLLRAVE